MIIKENYPIALISWLTTLRGSGCVKFFYEPESVSELQDLCLDLIQKNLSFDLIGHTSNTLYSPDYNCERMVSTRKLRKFEIGDKYIVCECGVPVRQLSIAAIELGLKGFEGTIDLPGTVAASLYGNAGCFGCSISSLLEEATIITFDGEVLTVDSKWFEFEHRSSVLKRKEKKAVILSVKLRKVYGNKEALKKISEDNHFDRKSTQPEAKNSLGSIFADSGKPTLLNYFLIFITKVYSIFLRLVVHDKKVIEVKRKDFLFWLLRAEDVKPYVRNWNWYQWTDEASHELFWKYVRLHKILYTKSIFEIDIKSNLIKT